MADEISINDKQVLKVLFNPNLPVGEIEQAIESVDDDREVLRAVVDLAVREPDIEDSTMHATGSLPDLLEQVKNLELKGVKHAEANRMDDALVCFNQAIDLLPEYAAGYNNRAQARRMKGLNQDAYDDLEKAILLSNGSGRTASLAFVQRALLRKLDGEDTKSLEDFEKAASLGNEFAKQQVVQANPYAALCSQMLGEAMSRLHGESHKE